MPSSTSTATEPTTELAQLRPSQLAPHPKNIRNDVGDLASLTDSIAAQGIQHPLVVAPNGKPDKYILIAGHRRLAAAKTLKLKTVPCIIDHTLTDEADQIAAMLAENIERQDLTAVEESDGVALLLDLNLNQKQIASRTGMSSARIRSRVKVAKLSDEVKARLTEHEVTLADAVFIADHAGNPSDLAALEAALGTNNWAVAKERQIKRDEERKWLTRVRKDAEAMGFEVVTDWARRREIGAEAEKKFGARRHDEMKEQLSKWPAPDVLLETALSDDTIAFVHIGGELQVGNGQFGPVALVVLSAPEPSTDTRVPEPDAAQDSDPTPADDAPTQTGDDTAPAADDTTPEPEPTVTETGPSPEELAAREHDALVEAATKVRRDFITKIVVSGDPGEASLFAKLAAEALRDLGGDGVDEERFPHPRLVQFLPIAVEPDTSNPYVASAEERAAVFAWLAGLTDSDAQLLVFALHYLAPLDQWLLYTEPYEHDAASLQLLLDYVALLTSCGHILSDIEIAARDAFQTALDEVSGNEE